MNKRQTKKQYKLKHGINPPNQQQKALHSLINILLLAYYKRGILSEVEFVKRLQRCDLDGQRIALELWAQITH